MKYLSLILVIFVTSLVSFSTYRSVKMVTAEEIQVAYPFENQISSLKHKIYRSTDQALAYQLDLFLETP
jgi:hypothetical protein